MNSRTFLSRLNRQRFFEDQIVHVKELPERLPQHAPVLGELHDSVRQVLERRGIKELYSHQASSLEAIRAGKNVAVVTGTASGKTLCYTLPVLETILASPQATMLFMYPTKALAQDQLRGLNTFQQEDLGISFMAGTYDGDTPTTVRRRLRDNGNIILTNPDMLHQGILPQHARWNRFFSNLRFVVIDEIHAYRGVFGSHLSNVVRRLSRICGHYGSKPIFICCSATIANPGDHAARICGVQMDLVQNDGSPRGPKKFVLWNPPPLTRAATGSPGNWRVGGDRRSSIGEAV